MRKQRGSRHQKRLSGFTIFVTLVITVIVIVGAVYLINPMNMNETLLTWFSGPEKEMPSLVLAQDEATKKDDDQDENQGEQIMMETSLSLADILARAENRHVHLGEQANLTIAIGAAELFSLDQYLTESGAGRTLLSDAQALKNIASLLFEVSLKAGLEVGDRLPHNWLPNDITPGFDVDFVVGKQDLKLYNPYDFEVVFKFEANDSGLSVIAEGAVDEQWKAPRIIVDQETFSPPDQILVDFSMNSSESFYIDLTDTVEQDILEQFLDETDDAMTPGKDGMLVKVYLARSSEDNQLLYSDFYPPVPNVIKRLATIDEWKSLVE